MNDALVSITDERIESPLWETGWARDVDRASLREHLGEPFYVETDSLCTFGGDEDWWAFRNSNDEIIAICLRVPYGDAIVCTSNPTKENMRQAADLILPWAIESFPEPRLR